MPTAEELKDKPYEIIDWPYVYMNGRTYKVLSRNEIKRLIKKEFGG